MPRSRRMIRAGKPYDLILRVKEGLPFVPLESIKLVLDSAVARAQRDNKITLCDHLWMGNHVHFFIVAWDAQQCTNFYQEVQKKVTEYFKRLTGQTHLNLWEGEPVLAEILDIDKAIEKIAYLYANPSRADLVETISEYPGRSSWDEFTSCPHALDAACVREVPWLRLFSIDPLDSLLVSEKEDQLLVQKLRASSKKTHELVLFPNAWMKAFGITEKSEIKEVNERIHTQLKLMEEAARVERKAKRKTVLGAKRLKQMPLMRAHRPKRRERRIFMLSSLLELRLEYLDIFKEFVEQCKECYQLLKRGVMGRWPPGAFRPHAPPLASEIQFS